MTKNRIERSPKKPFLDTRAKMVRQKVKKQNFDYRQKIWKMRDVSSKVLTFAEDVKMNTENKYPRICLCGRFHHNKRTSNVIVAKGQESKKSFYSNLVTCGSVWRCPVCSFKIVKTRQIEVYKLLSWYQENDYKMSFVTLTLRHGRKGALGTLLNTLLSEFRKFQRVRKFNAFRETYIGMVKALEITYSSKQGWHPHLHIMFVHKKGVRHEEVKLHMDELLPAWCKREAIKGNLKAQKYEPVFDEKGLTDYVTKWDCSKEITQGNFKTAGHGEKTNEIKRTTAFGMLSDVVDGTLEFSKIKLLFEHYIGNTRGRNHLIVSEGIRKKYKEINPNVKEDMDIVKDEKIEDFLFSIAPELWLEILKKDIAPSLLSAYDFGGFDRVCLELDKHKISYDVEFDEDLKINFIF